MNPKKGRLTTYQATSSAAAIVSTIPALARERMLYLRLRLLLRKPYLAPTYANFFRIFLHFRGSFPPRTFRKSLHITISGVYNASAVEQKYTLLFMDYSRPGTHATLDLLNILRRRLHEDLYGVFSLSSADIYSTEDIQICTSQITENGNTRWVTTSHAMATFPSREAAIRVYRQQQSPDGEKLLSLLSVPCIVHIAGKPAIDPGAKSLHQAWF